MRWRGNRTQRPSAVGFGRLHLLETSRRHMARLDEPIHVRDISFGPAAFGPSWSEFLHPGYSVERQLLPIDPTETQRLVERLGIRDRHNTRILLVNSQKQIGGPGVLLR